MGGRPIDLVSGAMMSHAAIDAFVDGSAITMTNAPYGAVQANSVRYEAFATGVDGQMMTISKSGAMLLIEDGFKIVTMNPGAMSTVDGRTISIPLAGGGIILDGTPLSLVTTTEIVLASVTTGGAILATGVDGQKITISQSDSAIVAWDRTSVTTIPQGSEAVFDGKTISAAGTPGVVVIDGSLVRLPTSINALSSAFVADGHEQDISIWQSGSAILVADMESTTAIAFGSEALFDGKTFSAPATAGIAIIDGSTMHLTYSTASSGLTVATTATTTLTAKAANTAGPSPLFLAIALLTGLLLILCF